MIFTENDKSTMQALSTLVKLSSPVNERKSAIIRVGQFMGVPKEDTLELMMEWDDDDTISLNSEEEKKLFLHDCFAHLERINQPRKSEVELYNYVVENLGLATRSNN